MTRWKLPAIIAAMFGTLVLGSLLTLFFTSSRMFSGTINDGLDVTPRFTPTSMSLSLNMSWVQSTATALALTLQPARANNLPNTGGGGGEGGGDIRQEQAEPIVTPGARVVIRDATLGLIVADPETRIDEITALAEEIGGWVVTSNVSGFTNVRGEPATRGSVTVRVPAERLDETLNRIAEGALQVTNRRIQGQDVTQDFVDTESRLRNLEAAEAQLQTLIEQATTVEEIMSVYRELVMTRGEIEVAQGRLNYFTGAAAYSSITVTLEPEAVQPLPTVEATGWNPLSTAVGAFNLLMRGVQFLIDAVIVILIVGTPLALVIGVPLAVVRARRPRSTPRSETPPAG